MDPNNFTKNIIADLKVDLSEEFDRNFERKGFFDQKWPSSKMVNTRGSVMARSNNLRRSIKPRSDKNSVSWSSSLPYASIHNEGGEIIVTQKMKSFFWAMFFKADGATTFKRNKDKEVVMRETERNKKLAAEAQQWKNLALQKVGSKMKITKRQFIGDHPIVRQRIEDVVSANFKELEAYFYNKLKQ